MKSRRTLPFTSLALRLALVPGLLACGDDGPPDMPPPSCNVPQIRFTHEALGIVPGIARRTAVELARDYACADAVFTLVVADPSVATAPAEVTIPQGTSRGEIEIAGVAVGTTTLTATMTAGDIVREATLSIEVTDASVPPCAGDARGNLAPGGRVAVAAGSLAGTAIALPAGASRDDRYHVDAFDAQIGCGAEQVPDGFVALGPPVTFGPAHARFMRELPMTLPVRLSLLPAGAHRGHVELSYTGPGVSEPRIVAVAFVGFGGGGGDALLTFEAPRLGTYQAVARAGAGQPRERDMTFRGMVGVSMGGAGTGHIAFRNPELFDFAAPLGAAWDWRYMLDYIRTFHVGGFCSAAEHAADTTGACDAASADRVPPARWIHEVRQDFEHWWYDERARGHGGTFDREEYMRLFRDLTMMFGNQNTDRTEDPTEPNITPPGIPDSERVRSDADRCMSPVSIRPFDGSAGTGFFDDEYNPEGLFPAITFCDGGEVTIAGERDKGVWDPMGRNTSPLEVALAIDRNDNGRRDPGEPIVRNFREPFEDCGMDRRCNPDEPGYDPTTNPDPSGDDYDYQYNAAGTEGNRVRDGVPCDAAMGEVFTDTGLDGVMGTGQLAAGGFDRGEGDGCFDMTAGMARMLDRGPLGLLHTEELAGLRDLSVFMDGGIRDLFQAAVGSNHTASGFLFRGLPLRYHNGHPSIHLDGRPLVDEEFVFNEINWDEVGQYVMVRYGDPDADPGSFEAGDGQHVGTGTQAVNRILSALAWMSARWPGGDRRMVTDRLCRTGAAGCTQPNQILTDFTSPTTGRVGPASIILPPGYFMPENAEQTYPVVYFLHGYGMEPTDLVDIAIIIWNFMTAPNIPEARRFQKMIFVFPDGRCRGEECVKGTFYADAPESSPGAAQMETWVLDLMDYVDATYRTRPTSTHTLVD